MCWKQVVTFALVLIVKHIQSCRRCSFDVMNVENIEILHQNLGQPTMVYECIRAGIPILQDTQKQQVRKIEIVNQAIPTLEEGSIGNFSRLEKVILNGNNMTRIKTAAFNNLTSLKHVSLSDNKIAMEFGIFVEVPKLLQLHLDRNGLSCLEQAWLGHIPTLEWLNLEYNSLRHVATGEFSNFPNLLFLNLGHNQIGHVDEDAFYGLQQLQILDLSYNKIRHIHDFTFAPVAELHVLNLYNNEMSFISDWVLENLSKLRELITLGNPWQCGCYDKITEWAREKSVRMNKNKFFKCAREENIYLIPAGCPESDDCQQNPSKCVANKRDHVCTELFSKLSDFECSFQYANYINI